jgi:hypothetical protein
MHSKFSAEDLPQRDRLSGLCFLLHLFLREHKQGLLLKTSYFKAQDVLDLCIFSWVFQHPIVLEVDIEKQLAFILPKWPNHLSLYKFYSTFHVTYSFVR